MNRVTDFRVDKASIPKADYDHLPSRAIQLIRAYAERLNEYSDPVTFEIAIYRWREIEAVTEAGEGKENQDAD